VTILNYDILKKLSDDATFDLLILDEAHYTKNPKSQRSKAVKALVSRCKRTLALTGTPILNKPIELWPILQMVAPETWDPAGIVKGKSVGIGEGGGFFRFAKRYCDAHEEYHGRTSHWEFGGHSNLEELQEKLRSTCMVRRLKADVLCELPAKRRQSVVIGNGCSDDFGDLGDDYETATERVRKIPFEDLSRVRHEQALRKVEPAIEHVRDAVEASNKVVVFAHHKDVIDGLIAGLDDLGVVSLTGDTSQADRQTAVERFQTDPNVHVIIGSLKAAGVGLTLTASSHVIFVEIDWVPASLTQAEDRCHRIGQTESVLVQHLVLSGSLDERMSRFVIEKQTVADMALDTDTTVDVSTRPIAETSEQVRARKLAENGLTEDEITHIHENLRTLAECCDGAVQQDGMGFNKLDTNFGKSLAGQERLSVTQALAAKKMLRKYSSQLEKLTS
jgi:SWI/SNF-related matrix-associated actin-dependent regulator 1 of chromatin subfamily A